GAAPGAGFGREHHDLGISRLTSKQETSRKAVFLDRDGTLNKNTHYLIDFEDFELLPGVETALRLLQELDYRLFVVSNQSGIARGLFPFEAVEALHRKIESHLAGLGIRLEEMAFCPHHPEGLVEPYSKECDCRKPKPGMLRYLASKYDIDIAESIMVGDSESDALTGVNAGARGVWLRPDADVIPLTGRVDNRANIKEFVSLLDFAESLRDID
ncbi:MAG: D,D-heptose 1,7-bisphosphate phosphatase, partial [Fibrobacteres bacterium]|nr:D,D-heptose 1,7-bisphosphate phosphatase [Fibrobacterota bacterium]